ncbi:MAG TPA: 50S ribosomal protein L3 N(5)-glutamine methyltransferase, partial [Gammaproteobacteria bacterium]
MSYPVPCTRWQLIDAVASRLEDAGLVFGHGTENAGDEAAWLVIQALGFSPAEPLPEPTATVEQLEIERVEALVQQRIQTRKPLAYLLNSAWFAGLEFYVDERVIVPRSPIAELIGREFSPWLTAAPGRILDLCTGSGCIAIACAVQFADAKVDATDISGDALAVAAINCRKHRLGDRVTLLQADVYKGLPRRRYDIIVSNPPYVAAGIMASLPTEYSAEPSLALAAGDDGLDIVRRILSGAADRLNPGGILVCEVGDSEEALTEAF